MLPPEGHCGGSGAIEVADDLPEALRVNLLAPGAADEPDLEARLLEPVGELDVLGAIERLVETADLQQPVAMRREVAAEPAPEVRLLLTLLEAAIVLRPPLGEVRGEAAAAADGAEPERADPDHAARLFLRCDVTGDQAGVGEDVVVDEDAPAT